MSVFDRKGIVGSGQREGGESLQKKTIWGHLAAVFTIMVWGTTFTSTKVLLRSFEPLEILFFRMAIAFVILFIAKPKKLVLKNKKHELLFAAAGLCGIIIYQILENYSLSFTMVANTSLIVTTSPFFIAILSVLFLKTEKPGYLFFAGFLAAIIGIAIISFSGITALRISPLGDLLALGAAVSWAFYSILTKQISSHGYSIVQVTRRIFGYALAFLIPILLFSGIKLNPGALAQPVNVLNLLFLGVLASAVCFCSWNYSVKVLGAVRTSVYIYLVPVISVVTSSIVLGETITWLTAGGIALVLLGLVLSDRKSKRKKRGGAT